jgi:hypothetical protein
MKVNDPSLSRFATGEPMIQFTIRVPQSQRQHFIRLATTLPGCRGFADVTRRAFDCYLSQPEIRALLDQPEA